MTPSWYLIDCAPREKIAILGWSKKEGFNVWWFAPYRKNGIEQGSWKNCSGEYYEMDEPTHWMPLPAAPCKDR